MTSTLDLSPVTSAVRPAPIGTLARYDSGWVACNNDRSFNLVFAHGFGVIPTQICLMFSRDRITAFPVAVGGNFGSRLNPVSIWVTTGELICAISAERPLYGFWDAESGIREHWDAGFFRAFVNP